MVQFRWMAVGGVENGGTSWRESNVKMRLEAELDGIKFRTAKTLPRGTRLRASQRERACR